MDNYESGLVEWAKQLKDFRFPRWDDLPEIELYMDQVISVIEKSLYLFHDQNNKIITPAMINNYVKLGLIPPPERKRYNQRHLAYLIAISVLKQVLTISEVRDGIIAQGKISGQREAYNIFCEEQEHALKAIASQILVGEHIPVLTTKIQPEFLMVKVTTLAFASKVLADKMIREDGISKEYTEGLR